MESIAQPVNEDSPKSIYIGGSYSLDGDGTSVGDCLIASHFALEHINNDSSILQGYKLKLAWGNAGVSTFDRFLNDRWEMPCNEIFTF